MPPKPSEPLPPLPREESLARISRARDETLAAMRRRPELDAVAYFKARIREVFAE